MNEDVTPADAGGTGDTVTPTFADALPEDLRGNDALKGFADAGSLAKAYLDTVGKVPVVPDGPDKYAVDGMDAKEVKAFAEVAHKAGMTNAQAAEALKYVSARDAARESAALAEREAGLNALKAEWPGETFKTNTALALRAVQRFASPELITFFDKSGLGDHPEMVKLFHKLGAAISEDSILTGGDRPKSTTLNRDTFGLPTLSFPDMANKH
jgi:hypothetical protein